MVPTKEVLQKVRLRSNRTGVVMCSGSVGPNICFRVLVVGSHESLLPSLFSLQ